MRRLRHHEGRKPRGYGHQQCGASIRRKLRADHEQDGDDCAARERIDNQRGRDCEPPAPAQRLLRLARSEGPPAWPPFIEPIASSSLIPRYTNGSETIGRPGPFTVYQLRPRPKRASTITGMSIDVPEDQRLRGLLLHHLIDREEIAGTDREVEARERDQQHHLRRPASRKTVESRFCFDCVQRRPLQPSPRRQIEQTTTSQDGPNPLRCLTGPPCWPALPSRRAEFRLRACRLHRLRVSPPLRYHRR